MVWLHDGEENSKISLFVLTQCTNVTDTHTQRHHMTALVALMHSIARQKPAWGIYQMAKKFDNMFNHFDRIHECDRQTERQTDRRRPHDSICRAYA